MDFNEEARYYGAKLCVMQARSYGSPARFASHIIEGRALSSCQTGLRVCKPLWMSLFTAKTGKMLPNGNRDFYYISFWKTEKCRMYRYALGDKKYSMHSF